jgi:hypothetical protein
LGTLASTGSGLSVLCTSASLAKVFESSRPSTTTAAPTSSPMNPLISLSGSRGDSSR